MLNIGSSNNNSVTWSDFIVNVYSDGSIAYGRMSSEGGTEEGLVGVSKSKILVELKNGKP